MNGVGGSVSGISGGSDSSRINLGVFTVTTGISLILASRGGKNDTYAAVLVFMIGLIQLFEYGVRLDLECLPGSSNDKASRGSYALIWAMPAILSIVGFLYADRVVGDGAGRWLMLGVGFAFTALLVGILPTAFMEKTTWCSTPGNLWQPIWWWQRERSPLTPNFFWLVGVILPTLLIDPLGLGAGTLVLAGGSYYMSRMADKRVEGEWLSITALLANSIGLWALLLPGIRLSLFGPEW
jgi:hypothetical protein